MKTLIKTIALSSVLLLSACASNPHKAEYLNLNIEKTSAVSNDSVIGVKDGNMVYQHKALMSETLRNLQITVFELEDRVYGGPRYYGNNGKHGALKECRTALASFENGGDGKLVWTEARDYVVPEEDFSSIGLDNRDQIIGMKEEFLKDRIARFAQYKHILEKRADDFDDKLAVCHAALKFNQKRTVAGQ